MPHGPGISNTMGFPWQLRLHLYQRPLLAFSERLELCHVAPSLSCSPRILHTFQVTMTWVTRPCYLLHSSVSLNVTHLHVLSLSKHFPSEAQISPEWQWPLLMSSYFLSPLWRAPCCPDRAHTHFSSALYLFWWPHGYTYLSFQCRGFLHVLSLVLAWWLGLSLVCVHHGELSLPIQLQRVAI